MTAMTCKNIGKVLLWRAGLHQDAAIGTSSDTKGETIAKLQHESEHCWAGLASDLMGGIWRSFSAL